MVDDVERPVSGLGAVQTADAGKRANANAHRKEVISVRCAPFLQFNRYPATYGTMVMVISPPAPATSYRMVTVVPATAPAATFMV